MFSELKDDPRQDAASKLKYLMSSQPRRIAGCHLLLRGNRWMPVSVNKTLGANDRCSPSGAVISAFLLAVIEGDMIVGWMKNSAFSIQQPQPDGTLTPLDLTAAALGSQADSADMKANKAGIIGVSSLIAARRIEEQNTGHPPSKLREAAFERATVQILDKLQGHSDCRRCRLLRLLIARNQLLMTVGDGFIPAALCGAGSRSVIPEWARQVSGVLPPRLRPSGAAVDDPACVKTHRLL